MHDPTNLFCLYHPARTDAHTDQCRCTILPPADIHDRATMPCPAPSPALLAAARRHDAMTSAAVMVRAPAPRRRSGSWRKDVRLGLAMIGFVLLPFVAHAAPAPTAPAPRCDAGRVVEQQTDSTGATRIVVRRTCVVAAATKLTAQR